MSLCLSYQPGWQNGIAEFNHDWNALMKVIEHVEEIVETEFDKNRSFYYMSLATIVVSYKGDVIFSHQGHATRHDRLWKNWKCCVEFIKWYNNRS